MESAINRRPTLFRLRTELIDRLKQMAANNNRSLNNFVETILMDVAYHTPNKETQAAMIEARDNSNLTDVDMSNYDSFLSSLDLK